MSLLTRLFGKNPPPTPGKAVEAPAPAVDPRPDADARVHEEESRLAQALASADPEAIGHWVTAGSSTAIRQKAAQAIEDPGQLRELIRATRHGKDKTVHRILTDKRDALLAEERRVQKQQAEIAATAAAIARLAERPVEPTYAAELAQLETRWRTTESLASLGQRDAVAADVARARAALEQHRRSLAEAAERASAAALAAEEARRQRELAAAAAATEAAEQAQQREAARQAERALREAEEARVRDMLSLLRQAQAALERGGSARAARLRDSIAAKLADAPALPAWYAGKLQQLDQRLEELKAWKSFTVEPKRAQLVERMQALIGADMSPEELARQIRRLREEWRTLHRGAGEEPTPEREQFDAAAERAYEPCREHFAKQAEQRKENQARREALLERLAAFAAAQSGDDPNWRAVQQALTESRREWREHAPVDQEVIQPLQARFHELTDPLQQRLDAEYARNVQAKRGLIDRAAALVEIADTRAATDAAKELQRAWRDVGLVPRHQDHALWEEFRRHCDAIFARVAEESAARGAALEASQARAIALCEAVERMAGLADEELASGLAELHGLETEFDALELPRAVVRDLRRRFGRAVERCQEAQRRERTAAARRGWVDAFAASRRVREWALAVAQGLPAEDRAALRDAATAAVAALAQAPRDAQALLGRQLERIEAGHVDADLAANEAALRMLCIRAELLTDQPTPEEDLERRREYQMQRLVASMGRGERPTPTELDDLAREWLGVGPVAGATQDGLEARFQRCREAYGE